MRLVHDGPPHISASIAAVPRLTGPAHKRRAGALLSRKVQNVREDSTADARPTDWGARGECACAVYLSIPNSPRRMRRNSKRRGFTSVAPPELTSTMRAAIGS